MFTHAIGNVSLTVLTDGPIELPKGDSFYTGDAHDCKTVAELNGERATFGQNPLIIDSPLSGRTLIDAGVGTHALLGSSRFGSNAGQLARNLKLAGIDPASFDRVLITHLHPDHSWGIANPDGTPLFPNATVHVHANEIDHWTNLRDISWDTPKVEANRKLGAFFVVQSYGQRLLKFTDLEKIAEDITAVPLPGHTPGHSIFWLETTAGRLVSWGDTCHHEAQISRPTVRATTDTGDTALQARQTLLSDLADEDVLVHAYHLPFPGLGRIMSHGTEFTWAPLPSNIYSAQAAPAPTLGGTE